MTVDLTQIPWDEIKPNSLLVIRTPPFHTGPDLIDTLDQFVYDLRDHVGDSVKVLCMRHDTEVFNVDEETMNQMGWFRREVPKP